MKMIASAISLTLGLLIFISQSSGSLRALSQGEAPVSLQGGVAHADFAALGLADEDVLAEFGPLVAGPSKLDQMKQKLAQVRAKMGGPKTIKVKPTTGEVDIDALIAERGLQPVDRKVTVQALSYK